MRPPPSVSAARILLPEPPVSLEACDPRPCRWRPAAIHSAASAGFGTNAVMVLIVLLLCALICALALYSAIRCFLRGGGSPAPSQPGPSDIPEPDRKPADDRASTVAYSAVLGLAGAECAICLTEFEEGERVRVLERCRHGFHVECIERWLCSRSSCPNCRSSCLPPTDSPSSSKGMELRERGEDCGEDGGRRRSGPEEPASSLVQP